jgi:alpha-methylacyl-CoA racemase
MAGPLEGFRVVEFGGLGPGPFAAMLLADMGADVIRIDRLSLRSDGSQEVPTDVVNRGRRSILVDVKQADGRALVLSLLEHAHALIDVFRPGVMERLGLGPAECQQVNQRLVYARMTGWGQTGPRAKFAGHDISYISLTGALWATGRPPDKPVPPLSLVGDYGGGGMFLAFGIACALIEADRSGHGQVIDAAMVDGAAVLSTTYTALRASGEWVNERGVNPLDTGFPHYEVYECADGKFVSIGPIENQFYDELVRLTGFEEVGDRLDPSTFKARKARWAALFRTRTRDEWEATVGNSDACLAPVLDWEEAPGHQHMKARDTYIEVDGITQPAPAPRFSRTPGAIRRGPVTPGFDTDEILGELGLSRTQTDDLRARDVVG